LTDAKAPDANFLSGGGETGALIRGLNWAATPLGAPGTWPAPLKMLASLVLAADLPMYLAWGRERTLIYNDGYAELLQQRHPAALGRPFGEVWGDMMDEVGPNLDRAFAGQPTREDELQLTTRRSDPPQEMYFAYALTPVRDEAGEVAGVFGVCAETTKRALAERRAKFMLKLERRLRNLSDAEAITAAAAEEVGLALKAWYVAYAEVDPSGEYAYGFSGWAEPGASHRAPFRRRLEDFGEHIADLRLGRPVVIDDVRLDPRTSKPEHVALHDSYGIRAVVVLPLIKQGRLAAYLVASSHAPRRWTPAEIDLLAEVAARTWSAVARARAEAVMHESEERLAAVVKHAPVAIVLAEAPSGRILLKNEQADRIWGAPSPDPKSIADYDAFRGIRPDSGAPFLPEDWPLARAIVSGEDIVGEEIEFRRHDGGVGTLSVNASPIRDANGRVIAGVSTAEDVTGRRATEAALRKLNDTLETEIERRTAALADADAARREVDAVYHAYFENSGEVLFVMGVREDGGLTLEQTNPAHEAVTGLSLERVRGLPLEQQFTPEIATHMSPPIRRAVETGQVQRYAETFNFGAGTRHFDTVVVPVAGMDGRISRVVGVAREVTAQVLAEEALRQAQKMEAVGQLTGGIAHDFNNLLGAVIGALDLIQKRPGDEDRVRKFAAVGLEAASRGVKLTRQFLAFSRAQRIELKPVVVADVVDGMRDMLARTLGPLVRLRFDVESARAAVLSDSTQIELAVLNLAINARDSMLEGGDLTIAIACREIRDDVELPPGEYVELSVTDTGAGMSPEVAARAFDPFFTTKGLGKGTGLGLSQVYGISRQAGGIARIESRPGQGTTVRMYLPVTQVCTAAPATAPAAAAPPMAAPGSAVLVIDDASVRRVLTECLRTIGYTVREAADGPSGLAKLQEQAPDLLLVDFAMPGMTGAEVAKAARARQPDLPIVFATGYADTAAIEQAVGCDAIVLHKPFRMDELQATLAKALAPAAP
jgi:PAS domain S-box-containing protein